MPDPQGCRSLHHFTGQGEAWDVRQGPFLDVQSHGGAWGCNPADLNGLCCNTAAVQGA